MQNRNMSPKKVSMPAREPEERIKDFNEVAGGYTPEMAKEEAARCLQCKHRPCVSGCPVNVPIPDFIEKITGDDFAGAYKTICTANSLPAVCGRVCPQERQCEAKCVRARNGEAVGIGHLERFAADFGIANNISEAAVINKNKDIKVAVLGSGPAGLSCAGELANFGYSVTVFEAFHEPGGVLTYGIPEFRLPKSIVRTEIENLQRRGVIIQKNFIAGRSMNIDELFEVGYSAVFIGTGAGLPRFMNIAGEALNGVYSANEFLTRINLMKAYDDNYDTPVIHPKKAVVVGGGNVAMDAARCARRLGAEVRVLYRRGKEEMPARAEEVAHACEEGIEFEFLTAPEEIIGGEDAWVSSVRCIRMELTQPDATGRRFPREIPGSGFTLETDCVIIAIGTSPNPIIGDTTKDLEINPRGCIAVDGDGRTSREGVFAGGDTVTGAATVILAMGAGKRAAAAINDYLQQI